MASKTSNRILGTGRRGKAASAKTQGAKWSIDISQPVGDRIMDPAAFEKFLHDRIKLEGGKPGQLGDKVKIVREGDSRINVTTTVPLSKRYLKFLTKKHLKKNGTRDFLRVLATSKNEYKLLYLDKTAAEDAEE